MASRVLNIIILTFCALGVFPMALNGPPLLRYDPCGLGVINFQKIVLKKLWMVSVNLGLYNLSEADIHIHFLDPVRFTWVSQNSSLILQENSTDLRLRPLGKVPNMYVFYVTIEGNNTLPVVKRFSLNNQTLCDDEERKRLNSTAALSNTCGRRSLRFTELTTYDTEATDGEWPWHVAITVRNPKTPTNTFYQCGGSIVSRTAVLTAGHCVSRNGNNTEANRIVIIAGTSNIFDVKLHRWPTQIFNAKEIALHPSYTDPLATADLAIIKIAAPGFQFNDFVQPICLWGPLYDKTQIIGRYGTVVGFGQTENGTYNQILRTANTLVQSDETCIDFNAKVYKNLMNEFTFCAGFGPESSVNPRNGDSGGGIIMPVQESDQKIRFYIKGVLSKCGLPGGAATCDPKFYVVYTDVGPHHGWIVHHIM